MQHGSFDLLLSVASNVMHSQGDHTHLQSFTCQSISAERNVPASKSRMKENRVKEDRQKRDSVGSEIEYQQGD